MPPTELEMSQVKQSFEDLRPYLEPTSLFFYEALFKRAPELRELFREDLKGQGMRFMNTLGLILADMEKSNGSSVDYAELGRLHATLGIRQAHFAPMEEALMESLGDKLGERFTPELEQAWRAAYEAFSKKLIESGNIPA
ncbi:globin domain-containing protein [Tropicimonas sediminicola]|uniref:Nitric oxide dioxygenase n=1 Tax=Tropicimonas sediminicola TaxID=1031541 RepID=A0A239C7B2_9RHOB|nr:globin domain-containing protein [Tropicimonas sediminicola]SNS16145.1 nitric oxide dioxygenase [Tropicimonas sediminicola]